jgi:DnaK suppressor protein
LKLATAKAKTKAKVVAKSTGKGAKGSTGKSVAKKPAPKTVKTVKKPAPKAAGKTVAKSKTAAKPVPKTAPKAAPKTPPKTISKPVPKTAAKPVSKPVAKPATKAVAKPVAVPVAKPIVKETPKVMAPVVQMTTKQPSTVKIGNLLSEAEVIKQAKTDYMSKQQLAFFKHRLLELQNELRENAGATTEHLREISVAPDPADRATLEEEHALELRTRDRERKLLKKVQAALMRIEDGSYGYCEETGEPIGIQRLMARPTATLTIEAQERRELKQKMYGE